MDMRATVAGTTTGDGPGSAERARERRAQWVAVWALVALAAVGYSVFALERYWAFGDGSYDLVIFDQAVRSYAHFQPGTSIIKGVHNGFGPHFSVLGDHWSPILASLAPFYWIHNGPQTLLVAQAVLFALAVPPIWLFTRRAFGGGRRAVVAAYLVSVAYLLSWPIAAALNFNFHEVAFAPVLIAIALERLQAGRLWTALIALAVLLLVKEDMGLLVAGIGLYLAVARPRVVPRQLLVGAVLMVAGVADTVLATYVLIPAFGGRSDYYWAYTALGHNVPQALQHLVAHPLSSLHLLITPRVKLVTLLWLFGAFCFLPLLSPISLALIPPLLERMLGSHFPAWWGTYFQYNAFLVVILACAAADGAARLDRWVARARARSGSAPRSRGPGGWRREEGTGTIGPGKPGVDGDQEERDTSGSPHSSAPAGAVPAGAAVSPAGSSGRGGGRVALGCAVVMCVVAVGLVPVFAFRAALNPRFFHRDARMGAAAAADAHVPDGVTVEAVNDLGPALSARDTVLLWNGAGDSPLRPPWVVADVTRKAFTFSSVKQQRERVALLERTGYRVVFQRRGYVVLQRVSAASASSSGRSGG
jgi:uncharacterized membrane protein